MLDLKIMVFYRLPPPYYSSLSSAGLAIINQTLRSMPLNKYTRPRLRALPLFMTVDLINTSCALKGSSFMLFSRISTNQLNTCLMLDICVKTRRQNTVL